MKEEPVSQMVVPRLSGKPCAFLRGVSGQVRTGTGGRWASLALCSPCASPLADPAMAGFGSSSPRGRHLFKVVLMVLVALVLLQSASSQPHRDFTPPGQQKREAPVDLLSQMGRSVRGALDAWVGPETVHLVSEVRKVFPAATALIQETPRRRQHSRPPVFSPHPLCHSSGCKEPQIPQNEARPVPAFYVPMVCILP